MTEHLVDAVLTFSIFGAELLGLLAVMAAIWIVLPASVRIQLRALGERAL